MQKLRDAVDAVVAQPRTRGAFEKLGAEVFPAHPKSSRAGSGGLCEVDQIRKQTGIKIN